MSSSKETKVQLNQIQAAILAGGLGTRLQSVVADRPKVLATVRGRPFLTYLLDQLATAGVSSVILCVGYMGELVKETLGHKYGSIELIYSQETSQLGTGGALQLALPLFHSESILVMNGDSFCGANLHDFYQWHQLKKAPASLLLAQVADTKRYGRVQVNSEGQITQFEEKGNSEGVGWINAGTYLIQRRLLETIPQGNISLERDIFSHWVGNQLYGHFSQGEFLDIGTPESYTIAEKFFAPKD